MKFCYRWPSFENVLHQRAIPSGFLCYWAIGHWATAGAGRSVGGEISNMLVISRQSVHHQGDGDQLPSRPINRLYPHGRKHSNWWPIIVLILPNLPSGYDPLYNDYVNRI